jgi:hypothetical protein
MKFPFYERLSEIVGGAQFTGNHVKAMFGILIYFNISLVLIIISHYIL